MFPLKQTASRIIIMPFRFTCFKIAFHFSSLCSLRVLSGECNFSFFLVHTLTRKCALMNADLAQRIAQREVREKGSLAERIWAIRAEQFLWQGSETNFPCLSFLLPSLLCLNLAALASVSLFREHWQPLVVEAVVIWGSACKATSMAWCLTDGHCTWILASACISQ